MELAIEWWAQYLHVQEDLQNAGLEDWKTVLDDAPRGAMTGSEALENIGGVLLALRDIEEARRLGFQQRFDDLLALLEDYITNGAS